MAGSFGAIGGDVTASIDNPAALGIFRSSEASVSVGLSPIIATGNWQGNTYSDNATQFNFNNIAWVSTISTRKDSGYLSSSFGLSYHKIKDFKRKVYLQNNSNSIVSLTDLMAGFLTRPAGDFIYKDDLLSPNAYNDTRLGWLSVLGYGACLIYPDENNATNGKWYSILDPDEIILPSYQATESGNISDYNLTYSGNVNNRVYFGIGLSMQSISYIIQSTYSEHYPNHDDYFNLNNYFMTTGFGANFKVGVIVRATDFMRLGFSLQTPTWYSMRDRFNADLKYSVNDMVSTPDADYFYKFSLPLKAQASVGFIIAKKAAINIDYQFSDKQYSMSDAYGKFDIDHNKNAKYIHTVKLGAEVRLSDNFKIRAGGAFISAPINQNAAKLLPLNTTRTDFEYFVTKNTFYGTFGIGYAKNFFGIDLAYAYQQQNHNFFAAENFDNFGATLKTHNHNIVATVAFRY